VGHELLPTVCELRPPEMQPAGDGLTDGPPAGPGGHEDQQVSSPPRGTPGMANRG